MPRNTAPVVKKIQAFSNFIYVKLLDNPDTTWNMV